MALQGFDQSYYLGEKLAALKADPTTASVWATRTAQDVFDALKGAGLTPEQHYLQYGYNEGLAPNPYFNAYEYVYAKAQLLFNAGGYASIKVAFDAFTAAWSGNPYQHYLMYGDAEGINPSNAFDVVLYYQEKLTQLQDPTSAYYDASWAGKSVAQLEAFFHSAGLTALGHYEKYGQFEGLTPIAVPLAQQVPEPHAGTTFNLTTANDVLTANVFNGDLTPFIYGGNGPTLNSLDKLTGVGTNPTLHIYDGYASGNDIIPTGLTLNNIQTITLDTAGNAGNGQTANYGTGGAFDTTAFPTVAHVIVTSAGTSTDNVNAGPNTTVSVTHNGIGIGSFDSYQTGVGAVFADINSLFFNGSVVVNGGSDVTVTSNGGGYVGIGLNDLGSTAGTSALPTGNVVVTENYGNVLNTIQAELNGTPYDIGGGAIILGGKDVTVNITSVFNDGFVFIGNANDVTKPSQDPSGNIIVNDAGFGSISIQPSATTGRVTVTSAAGYENKGLIQIGDYTGTIVNQTAVINVTDHAGVAFDNIAPTITSKLHNNNAADVYVAGGSTVNVTTNAGSVYIGNGITGTDPTGAVTVIDTATDNSPNGAWYTPLIAPLGTEPAILHDGGTAVVEVSVSGGTTVSVAANNDTVLIGTGAVVGTWPGFLSEGGSIPDLTGNPPTGAVTVIETADIHGSQIYGAVSEPTGSGPGVVITSFTTTTPWIEIDGGTTINVTARGQGVFIDAFAGDKAATGAIVVSQTSVLTGRGLAGFMMDGGTAWPSSYTNGGVIFNYPFENGTVVINGGTNVTVNTTGGSVLVGDVTLGLPSGAIAITNTYGGQNDTEFYILGGTGSATVDAVHITTTSTDGNLNIGQEAVLNTAGDTVKNTSVEAHGNVTFVNVDTHGVYDATTGVNTEYGISDAHIYTNGAATVSLTGVHYAEIVDVQTTIATSGLNAGLAVGASALATVNLTGLSGSADIYSDALTALSTKDSSSDIWVHDNSTTAHALSLTLSNVTDEATIYDDAVNVLTVTTTGTAANDVEVEDLALTSAIINNSAKLTIELSDNANLASITAGGSAALNLGDLSSLVHLATINAVGASGGVSVEINPSITLFTGGAGNDVLALSQNDNTNPTTFLPLLSNGGGGTNTLVADYVAQTSDVVLGAEFDNFTILGLGVNASDGTTGTDYTNNFGLYDGIRPYYDATGFTGGLTLGEVDGNVTFYHVAAGTPLLITDNTNYYVSAYGVSYILRDATGSNDSLPVTIGNTDHAVFSWVGAPDIENVNVTSIGKTSVETNILHIADSAAKTVNIYGTADLSLSFWDNDGEGLIANNNVTSGIDGHSSNIVTINAATSSGAIDVSEVVLKDAATTTITGGAGLLTANLSYGGHAWTGAGYEYFDRISTANADTVTSGSGGIDLTLGSGGGWNATEVDGSQNGITYYGLGGSGNNTVHLLASIGAVDHITALDGQLSVFNSTTGGITDFQVVASTLADGLSVTSQSVNTSFSSPSSNLYALLNHKTVVNVGGIDTLDLAVGFDPSGSFESKLSNLQYTSSNGVITFSTVDGHALLADFTVTDLIQAAELIVDYASTNASSNTHSAAAIFQAAGSTYVVAAPSGSLASSPLGITQTITDPTITIGSSATSGTSLHVVVDGADVSVTVTNGWTPTQVAAAIVTAINNAHINSSYVTGGVITASASAGVVTVAEAQTVIFAAGPTGVTATTTNEAITTNDTNTIVELVGVTGVTGFDAIGAGAGHSILVDTVTNNIAPLTTGTGTAADRIFTFTGYSSIDENSFGTSLGTHSTTLNGLADSALLAFNSLSGSNDYSSLIVNQVGLPGTNSIAFDYEGSGSSTVNSVTLNGDWYASLTNNTSDPNGVTISSLVDGGGSAATLSHLALLGSGNTTISAITDKALTLIDAHAATGDISLGGDHDVTISGSPITNAHLTIELGGIGGSGTSTVFAYGDYTTITQASGANTGDLFIHALGNNDVLSFATTGDQNRDIWTTGTGVTVTVTGGGANPADTNIGGNLDSTNDYLPSSATGANDTFNLVGFGHDHLWVGLGDTVDLTKFTGNAHVEVTGDAYGTGAGLVTIAGLPVALAASASPALWIDFTDTLLLVDGVVPASPLTSGTTNPINYFGASQVNEYGVTTLADALNRAAAYSSVATDNKIAAHTGVLDWFQFNGDTYIVESENTGATAAAHTALGAHDVVVKLAGLVDLSQATVVDGVVHLG